MTVLSRFYKKKAVEEEVHEKGTPATGTPAETPSRGNSAVQATDLEPKGRVPAVAIILGAVASIGGFMFGYVRYVLLFFPPVGLHPRLFPSLLRHGSP